VVFFAIVAFHILLIYAFSSGLAMRVMDTIAPPIDTKIIDEVKPKDDLPPPPPPPLERPPVQIVAPEISITLSPDAPPPPIRQVTTQVITQPPPRPPPPGTNLARTSGPSTEDYYPSSSKIAGQEGRPVVKVCVSAGGKLDSADVTESSGFPQLDEAAVRIAKASRWKAATEEGKPVAKCASLPIRFSLKKVTE
jgi:protein TonB